MLGVLLKSSTRLRVRLREPVLVLPEGFRPFSLRKPLLWLLLALFFGTVVALSILSRVQLNVFLVIIVGCLLPTGWMLALALEAYPGRIRVGARGNLRFISRELQGGWSVSFSLLLCGVVGTLLIAAFGPVPAGIAPRQFSPRLAIAVLAMIVCAVYPFHRGIPPVGVELHADGVHTRKGLSRVFLPWDQLLTPSIVMVSKKPVLGLVDTSGQGGLLYSMYFGSDPVIVAEVIEFYRTHPGERHLLADPIAALARVVEIER